MKIKVYTSINNLKKKIFIGSVYTRSLNEPVRLKFVRWYIITVRPGPLSYVKCLFELFIYNDCLIIVDKIIISFTITSKPDRKLFKQISIIQPTIYIPIFTCFKTIKLAKIITLVSIAFYEVNSIY